jgi:hypothetical protein
MSQWDNLLKNLGAWRGSFTRLAPNGVILEDIPTLVTLEGIEDNRTIRQTIQHFSPTTGEVVYNRVLQYSSLNRSILFFANGAFSQGSIQFAPFTDFGAEFGLIAGDRRLRLVQLFDQAGQLAQLTLIREARSPSLSACPPERLPLTVAQLLGHWQGEAVTIYSDWRSPDCYLTQLHLRQEGDRLIQELTTPQLHLTTSAQIDGSTLRFQHSHPIQVLLLADACSSNTPQTIPKDTPFFLEMGWLIEPNLRYRLIRSYDNKGGWVSLTLVTERKVTEH